MLGLEHAADWFDKQIDFIEGSIWAWVNAHPKAALLLMGPQGLFATSQAPMLARGTVDVLRLGEGIREGGFGGYGQDALRLVSLAPGVGALTTKVILPRVLGPLALTRALAPNIEGALAASQAGGRCAWISQARAINMLNGLGRFKVMGGRFWVTVEDLAKQLDHPLDQVEGLSHERKIEILKRLKIRFTEHNDLLLTEIDDVVKRANGRPVLVGHSIVDRGGAIDLVHAREMHSRSMASSQFEQADKWLKRGGAAFDESLQSEGAHSVLAYWDTTKGHAVYVDYDGVVTRFLPGTKRQLGGGGRYPDRTLLDSDRAQEIYGFSRPEKAPRVTVLHEGTVARDAITGVATIAFPVALVSNAYLIERGRNRRGMRCVASH